MTSKFKCPVCQNNLHKINIVVSTCTNDKCKLWGSSIPNLVLEALAQAKRDLEQSEKCCSAWETQALDYKAETIALSGKLEIAREALEGIKKVCDSCRWCESNLYAPTSSDGRIIAEITNEALKLIEHKDKQWIR